jgi:hypothetical protein
MKSIAYLLMVAVATMVMVSCPALELDCRVTLDNQQGSAPNPKSILVMYGQPCGALVETTQESYLFDGWWARANGIGVKVEETTVVSISSSHTLYAKKGSRQLRESARLVDMGSTTRAAEATGGAISYSHWKSDD